MPKLRVMLRYARILLLSCLSAVPIGGCTQWQPIDVSSGYAWQGEAYHVRVTGMRGETWILSDFHVAGDTLRGSGYEGASYRDRIHRAARGVEVALQDIAVIEQRTRRTEQEVLLGGGVVAASALTLILLLP